MFLWQSMHFTSGFRGSAVVCVCSLVPAEALIGKLSKTQTIKRANITVDKTGNTQSQPCIDLQRVIRVSVNCPSWVREYSLSCDAPPIGVIRSNIAPIFPSESFQAWARLQPVFFGRSGPLD